MSYAPDDDINTLERMIRDLKRGHLVEQPAAPVRVPAGHVSRSQRRALAKRNDTLRALALTPSMTTFCPALGVSLVLSDERYALAALSWWWATRVSGPGLC